MTTAPAPPTFRSLALEVRALGLLHRRLGHYWIRIALTVGAYAVAWWAFFASRSMGVTVGVAVLLGLLSTQLGFLGHDAGHRQIFASARANRLCGLLVGNLLIGLSFGWWVPKHSAHHAHPNEIGRDPDVGMVKPGSLNASVTIGGERSLGRWMESRQAELFFPLMLLRSTGLYLSGAQALYRRRDRAAALEAVLLTLYAGLYLTAVFWVLHPIAALVFIGVNQAVFSFYLGCSFAPNHKGMPYVEIESGMSFAQRQVITSRNVVGGWCTGFVFGGLNYQIEHHLFPAMPRPNLPRARGVVRSYCRANGFEYREDSVIGSFRQAVQQLRVVRPPTVSPLDVPLPVVIDLEATAQLQAVR